VAATAAVGFLTAGGGNKLGAHVLGVETGPPGADRQAVGVRRFPARTGRTHLLGLLRTLLAAPRGGEGAQQPALAEAIAGLRRSAPRRGLVVVVSDFLDGLPETDDPAARPDWEEELRRVAVRHQVLAVEVTDPRELELPDVGLITLVDPESGQRREVSTGDRRLRERYAAAAAAQRDAVRQALRRAGAAHLPLRTDRDWVADIVRHVYAQRRLAMAATPKRGTA
jgi:uncharacterized protein (DUF58 family)